MRPWNSRSSHLAFLLIALALASAGSAQRRAGPAPESTVLFVCEHGTVTSLLATLLFDEYAAEVGLPMRAESRGSAADSTIPSWMRSKLSKSRLSLGDFAPRGLAAQDLANATMVVSFDVPARVHRLVDALDRARQAPVRSPGRAGGTA